MFSLFCFLLALCHPPIFFLFFFSVPGEGTNTFSSWGSFLAMALLSISILLVFSLSLSSLLVSSFAAAAYFFPFFYFVGIIFFIHHFIHAVSFFLNSLHFSISHDVFSSSAETLHISCNKYSSSLQQYFFDVWTNGIFYTRLSSFFPSKLEFFFI